MQEIYVFFSLIAFTIVTAYTDLRYKKIFNTITFPFFLAGLIFNTGFNGFAGLLIAFSGALIGLIILLFPFIWGWLGGGDIKFLMAAGAWIGPYQIVVATVCGLILFGIAASLYLILQKKLKSFISQLIFTVFSWPNIKQSIVITPTGSLPLGVFLGLGVLINWLIINF